MTQSSELDAVREVAGARPLANLVLQLVSRAERSVHGVVAGEVFRATAEAGAVPMIRDPNLDKLLAAHRQFGGASALGTSSGFLRNATFEAPSR